MEDILQTIRLNWILLCTFVALVLGWGRFEYEQHSHRKMLKKHNDAFEKIERRFDDEIMKKISIQDTLISGIKTDIEWTKGTLQRVETKIDAYLLSHK